MSGLLLLIPIALALGLAGLATFLWALQSGQFDDLDGAAGRVLFDDEPPPAAGSSQAQPQPPTALLERRSS
jgi:cbb3-type cytochrome oxidase maturation protein